MFIYVLHLGDFPLMDYDESKYVLIAKALFTSHDWINLKLNGNNFYECPPLLFWLINISFFVFGEISAFTARIPTVIFLLSGIIVLFSNVSKIMTKTYAFIISLIFSTCFGILVFGHLATNDIIFTSSSMISILCSYNILIEKKIKNSTLLWFLIHLFNGFAILCGGLMGIIPILTIFVMHIFAGKLKNIFKPINSLLFSLIIIFIVLPWFIIMVKNNGIEYIKEFLSSYNFIKYAGIKNYTYNIGLFIAGFMPWTFAFLWIIGTKFKDIRNSVVSYIKDDSQDKLKEKWQKLSKTEKFLSLNTIVFFTSLIFAILYGSKYTYIMLLLTFPASCISGHYWYEYMFKKEHSKSIFFATIIPNIFFIICAIGLLLGHKAIDNLSIYGAVLFVIPLVTIFFVIPLISIFAVTVRGKIPAFILNIILMISLTYTLMPSGYNFISVNSGESDLIEFARKAHENGVKLSAFIPSRKYSLEYYYENRIDFHNNTEYDWLEKYITENEKDYIVTEIKDLWNIEDKQIKYMLLDSGKRYCLIKYLPKTEEIKLQNEEEPEVIIQ